MAKVLCLICIYTPRMNAYINTYVGILKSDACSSANLYMVKDTCCDSGMLLSHCHNIIQCIS